MAPHSCSARAPRRPAARRLPVTAARNFSRCASVKLTLVFVGRDLDDGRRVGHGDLLRVGGASAVRPMAETQMVVHFIIYHNSRNRSNTAYCISVNKASVIDTSSAHGFIPVTLCDNGRSLYDYQPIRQRHGLCLDRFLRSKLTLRGQPRGLSYYGERAVGQLRRHGRSVRRWSAHVRLCSIISRSASTMKKFHAAVARYRAVGLSKEGRPSDEAILIGR